MRLTFPTSRALREKLEKNEQKPLFLYKILYNYKILWYHRQNDTG